MYNTTFFARKIIIDSKTGREAFTDIGPHLNFTRSFGPGPYYKIQLKECLPSEDVPYFGWKDYEQKKYDFIYPWQQAVNMCFPYGIKAEENKGSGKLVGFTIEDCIEVANKNLA